MKSEDILRASVQADEESFGPDGVTEAIKRAQGREEETNAALLETYRAQINGLVWSIRETGDLDVVICVSIDLKDGLVIRYIKNKRYSCRHSQTGSRGSFLFLRRSEKRL